MSIIQIKRTKKKWISHYTKGNSCGQTDSLELRSEVKKKPLCTMVGRMEQKQQSTRQCVDIAAHLDRNSAQWKCVLISYFIHVILWWVRWLMRFSWRSTRWFGQHRIQLNYVNRTHMEFIYSNGKQQQQSNEQQQPGILFVRVNFFPFTTFYAMLIVRPSDILIPRIIQKRQNETNTHTVWDGVDKYIFNAPKSFMHVKYFYNLNFSRQ